MAAFVQASPYAKGAAGGSTVTPAFGVASTAGTILLCFVTAYGLSGSTDPTLVSLPSGWVNRGTALFDDSSIVGQAYLFEYPDNPGAITSVAVVPNDSGITVHAVMGEFSGAKAYDTGATAGFIVSDQATITASPNPSDASDLGIAWDFCETANSVVPAVPNGWTNIGANPNDSSDHVGARAAYKLSTGVGTLSATFDGGTAGGADHNMVIAAYRQTLIVRTATDSLASFTENAVDIKGPGLAAFQE